MNSLNVTCVTCPADEKMRNLRFRRNALMMALMIVCIVPAFASGETKNALSNITSAIQDICSGVLPLGISVAVLDVTIAGIMYATSKNARKSEEIVEWGKRIFIGAAVAVCAAWLIKTLFGILGTGLTGTKIDDAVSSVVTGAIHAQNWCFK